VKLRKNHNFFEANASNYEASPLKRIITRFEYIMNTYLREFVRVSIEDWVSFMKSFTVPKTAKGELWKVPTTPMIVINLNIRKAEKDEKKKKKTTKKKEGNAEGGPAADESDEDQNRITYFPKLEKVEKFF
jgi:hypothetical protein